jgi:phosphatidylglycerol---prolipoprotein diacylglyceryl transferase
MLAYLSWDVAMRRELFGVPYFPHGILSAAGFLLGCAVMLRHARRRGVDVDAVQSALAWVALGAIVGARLFWVTGNWAELESTLEAFALWHGGLTLFGGIAGGLTAGVIALRRLGLPVLPLLDLAAPGLAAGLIVGRVACLVTGDHLGRVTGLPWGFRYVGSDAAGADPPLGSVVHPVALYDLLLVAVLVVVLVRFLRRPRMPGAAAAVFALWYSAVRLGLDFLRTDPTRAFGLTGTQLASAVTVVLVGAWLLSRWRSDRRLAGPAAAA